MSAQLYQTNFNLSRFYTGLCILLLFISFTVQAQETKPLKSWQDGGFEMRATGTETSPTILQDAIMLSSSVEVEITGFIARTTLRQKFRNNTAAWVEGTYRFPLPNKAAIDGYQILVGDKRIIGKIKEKQEAKRIYQEAVKAGKKASLLSQIRPNMFSSKVGNIAPGSMIEVEITFLSYAEQNGLNFSWRLPQAITPRYNEGDAFKSSADHITAPSPNGPNIISEGSHHYAVSGKPANQTAFNIFLNAGTALSSLNSPSHDIAITENSDYRFQISLRAGTEAADRDFILNWRMKAANTAKPVLLKETTEEGTFVLGMVMPPSKNAVQTVLPPRDISFIVDVSSSMLGTSIEQAKQALLEALDLLREQDKFDIILFNHEFSRFFGSSKPASPQNIAKARAFVTNLEANGGTEMVGALTSALSDTHDNENLRQILFLTDGAIGYEDKMFQLVENNLGQARLFTVGLGYAPNGWFMRKAAEFGRGINIQIDDTNAAREQLSGLFRDMANPSVRNIAASSNGFIERYPAQMPDLFGERPAVFVAKIDAAQTINLYGTLRSGASWEISADLDQMPKGAGISKLWARKKVEDITNQRLRGLDADDAKQKILAVALKHKIISPHTSFVAVEEKISRIETNPLRSTLVKRNLPKGAAAQQFFGPKTSTPMGLKLMLGLMSLLTALVLIGILRANRA